ncbi:hypothetical protein ACQJ0O_24155 [Pseudomonas shirazensis]|uniref:hypothetical protein n=1 Tax=Pseudomonas shirazensis TaxID=2745494 RepID=UPI003D0286D5
MQRLIALLKKKPQWLAHEGYWRLLQISRLAVAIPLALWGLGLFVAALSFDYGATDYAIFGVMCLAASVATFAAVHGTAWLLVWVKSGFSETKKS